MAFKKNDAKLNVQRIIKDIDKNPPNVFFLSDVMIKMKLYVDESSEEISWIGFVKKSEEGYTVYDVMLLEQETTGTTTEISESALNTLGNSLLNSGQIQAYNEVRCWGHSHVNMAVFASGTDDKTFESFYEPCEYFIRLICNKSGEMKLDFVDCTNNIRYDNINWYVVYTGREKELMDNLSELYKQADDIEQKLGDIEKEKTKMINVTVSEEISECVKKNITTHIWEYGQNPTRTTLAEFNMNGGVIMEDTNTEKNTIQTLLDKEQIKKKEKKNEEEEEDDAFYINTFCTIKVNYGDGDRYLPITDIFSDEDIIECVEKYDAEDIELHKMFHELKPFLDYNWDDWCKLGEIMFDYYADIICTDEV